MEREKEGETGKRFNTPLTNQSDPSIQFNSITFDLYSIKTIRFTEPSAWTPLEQVEWRQGVCVSSCLGQSCGSWYG